ncbi:MAG: type II 3-dehydroquinate dehydratase, partial [Sediminibacterium sp.]|nr:type II 3-dehydroquinate dehydratase [Sediminibacterium sp.]
MKITIINGPNLNLLGKREPGIYGQQTFSDYYQQLTAQFPEISFSYIQSNVEGEIVTAIQQAGENAQGIV